LGLRVYKLTAMLYL